MSDEDKNARVVDTIDPYRKGKKNFTGPEMTLADLANKCLLHYAMGDKEPIELDVPGQISMDKKETKKLMVHFEITVREAK